MWRDLVLAGFIGVIYALIVLGPAHINPRNVGWISFDPAYHYIGWELLRQDPHTHWPLTYTDRIGYPVGESAALLDLNPLMAVVLRPFSPLLPEPMQYFGIEVLLCCVLQFFFAFRILRLLPGAGVLGIALGSIFFVLSPPLNYRFMGHYSLSNHWVLLAAVLLFLRAQFAVPDNKAEAGRAVRSFVLWGTLLTAVSVGINPYLAFQVLAVLAAGLLALFWQKRLSLLKATGALALFCGTGFAVAYSLGFVIEGGRGYSTGGYRSMSLNLLAPFDPRGWKSLLLPRLPGAAPGQYEGYSYLGLGILLLAFIALVTAIWKRHQLPRPDYRWILPLLLSAAALTLLALSTRVTLGSHTVLDIDPAGKLTGYFASLRASGRLFWTPYYLILLAVVAAPLLLFPKLWANLLLACALILQIADTQSLRHWVLTTVSEQHPSPLQSPIWSQLGALHQNLIVLPSWQCNQNGSPLGIESYRFFGFLAVEQKMRINTYQSARFTEVARDWHCHQGVAALSQEPLAPDSAYVVTLELAARIAAGPTGPGKCHDLDRVILCSVRSDFGLSPELMTPEARLASAIANSGFEDGNTAPWSTVWEVNAQATPARAHSGKYSLAESGLGSVYQDLTLLEPGATYTVSAWVSASPGATAGAQLSLYDPAGHTVSASPFTPAGQDWRQITQSFVAGVDGTARLHLLRGPSAGTLYWDDVQIVRTRY